MKIRNVALVAATGFLLCFVAAAFPISRLARERSASPSSIIEPFQDKAVSISNVKFEPKVVRVKAGSSVTWTDKEGTHTVTADNGDFESPSLSTGQSFSHKFDKPGSYRYYCNYHGGKGGEGMSGTVIVTK
jgi:plastocyanin